MIPFKEDIKKWLEEGLKKGATHMIIFRDLNDGQYKKILIFNGESSKKIYEAHDDKINHLAIECYSLKKDMEEQLNQGLIHNFD